MRVGHLLLPCTDTTVSPPCHDRPRLFPRTKCCSFRNLWSVDRTSIILLSRRVVLLARLLALLLHLGRLTVSFDGTAAASTATRKLKLDDPDYSDDETPFALSPTPRDAGARSSIAIEARFDPIRCRIAGSLFVASSRLNTTKGSATRAAGPVNDVSRLSRRLRRAPVERPSQLDMLIHRTS